MEDASSGRLKNLASSAEILQLQCDEFLIHAHFFCKNTIVISIKHDLARSGFQLWPKIGDEGDKISRKKTGEALAETVFSRNFVTLGADFEGHN